MSIPDDPRLLTTPRKFAVAVLEGEAGEDLGPDISNLLGFTKGFYLQYFAEEHGIEVSRLDSGGRRRVRAVEERLRAGDDQPAQLLVSHYITISSRLDESSDTSDELERNEAYEEVLLAVLELLDRVAVWAAARGLDQLASEARVTHGRFDDAVARLLPL